MMRPSLKRGRAYGKDTKTPNRGNLRVIAIELRENGLDEAAELVDAAASAHSNALKSSCLKAAKMIRNDVRRKRALAGK